MVRLKRRTIQTGAAEVQAAIRPLVHGHWPEQVQVEEGDQQHLQPGEAAGEVALKELRFPVAYILQPEVVEGLAEQAETAQGEATEVVVVAVLRDLTGAAQQ